MENTKYLFVTHGKFGKGVVSALEVILGDMLSRYSISCIEINKDTSNVSVIEDITKILKENYGLTTIILTDIAIGSSTQNCIKAMDNLTHKHENIHLITGINLSLVLSLFMLEETGEDLSQKIEELIIENKEMPMYFNKV